MQKLTNILIILIFSILIAAPLTLADGVLRGFSFDALTVDGDDDLAVIMNHVTANNVNAFRVPYFYPDFDEDFANEADKGAAKYLDWIENTVLPHLAWIKQSFDPAGVRILLTLANPVGGRDVNVSPPEDRMFNDAGLQEAQIQAWEMIAEVYNNDPLMDYQVFNEPGTTTEKWKAFYPRLVAAVQAKSPSAAAVVPRIVIMSTFGNPDLIKEDVDFALLDPNGSYGLGLNFYAPFEYTHQGLESNQNEVLTWPLEDPEVPDCSKLKKQVNKFKKKFNKTGKKKFKNKLKRKRPKFKKCKKERKAILPYSKEGLRLVLEEAISFLTPEVTEGDTSASTLTHPLFVPEYAVPAWAGNAGAYLDDLHEVFNEVGAHTFNHILFSAGVWDALKDCDRSTGDCVPIATSDRFDSLLNHFANNQ